MRLRLWSIALLGSTFLSGVTALADTVTVDFSVDRGPATWRASGFLHSFDSTTPPASLVNPLKPRLFRGADPLADPALYSRLTNLGARAQFVISDAWGYAGVHPGDNGDWTAWDNLVANLVNQAVSRGQNFQWDIWNEPDHGFFWQRSEAQYQAMWARAVRKIRSITPNADIVGPSTTGWNGWSTNLLLYAKANNVLPTIVSWHELSGEDSIAGNIANARSFLSTNGIPIQRISIHEIVDSSSEFLPGRNLRYLAAIERGQIESAAHSCWNNGHDTCWDMSLDGLIMPDGVTRRGAWWAYKGYADITGRIVNLQPSASVDGVAGQDSGLRQAYSVFGRNGAPSQDLQVQFNRLSSVAYLNNGGRVHVVAYRLANDAGSGSSGPTQIINADFTIASDQIIVTIPGLGADEVAMIQLTPGSGATPPPAVPTNLSATAGNAQASLSWTASSGATSYNVKRAQVSGGPYTQVANITATSYVNTGLTNGQVYFYVVTAVNAGGQSGNSNQASATPVAPPPPPPAAPTNLVATAGNAQVSLSWTASSGATSYNVKRSQTSGGPYTQVANITATSYVNTGLTNGQVYFYVVTAVNAGGQSGNSNQASATPVAPPPPPPAAPTNLSATAGNAQVSLSWTASSGATSYNVKRAQVSGGPYTQVANVTTVNYVNTGLTNGQAYFYVVTAVNTGGQSGNSNQASATPVAPPPPPPAAPTNLAATAGNAQVSLSWTASSGAASYNVKRAQTSGGPYTQVANIAATSYVNTGLTNGQAYFYVVTAVNVGGESGNSNQASATPVAPPPPPPAAPTNLTATAGNAQVSLSWTASSGATSYNVKRAQVSGGPYTQVANVTTVNYVNTGLTNGQVYFYVVTAVNAGGQSGNSNQASATPVVPPPPPPAAPTNLTATAGNAQVSLSWTASSGATSYNVKRAQVSGGPYTQVANVTTVNYVNTGLTNGQAYFYVVTAVNTGGQSGNSNQASATPVAPPPPPPAAPTNLAATAGNAQVSLSWTASSGATSYNVKRAQVSGGPYTQVANVTSTNYTNTGLTNGQAYFYVVTAVNAGGESGNSSQASATPVAPPPPPVPPSITTQPQNVSVLVGQTANFSVTATGNPAPTYQWQSKPPGAASFANITGATTANYSFVNAQISNNSSQFQCVVTNSAGSITSNAVTLTVVAPIGGIVIIPSPPNSLGATAGNAQVSLSWSASSGATSYNVKRAQVSGGPYTQVANVTSTNYTNTGLTNGQVYFYVVSAVNSAGQSGNSNQASATPVAPPPPPPAAPTNLTATAGNAQVSLSWTASSGATSYNVKRSQTSGGPYTQVANVTATSYVNTGLTNGQAYFYVVTAVNVGGESGNSNQASATPVTPPPPPPAAPTNLAATAGNAQVSLSWTASSGAASYNVKRAQTSGGPYTQVGNVTSTNYTNTGLTNGQAYFYVVTAVNVGGESGNSNQASATPVAPPPPPPAAPTNLVATAGNAQVSLSWTASSAATSYNVKRAQVSGGPYTQVANVTATSYVNTGLTNGQAYFYVVTALNSGGESGNSNQVSATPVAPPPPPVLPSITTQPQNVSSMLGQNVTFSVTATGTPAPTYQWQTKAPSATTFATISGATGSSYITSAATQSDDGAQFQVVVTNSAGSIVSEVATWTVTYSLPAPTLNLSTYVSINDSVDLSYPSGYNITSFEWSFTLQTSAASSSLSSRALAAASGVNAFATSIPRASLASHHLQPGYYLVRVIAKDANNRVSAPAQAYVTLVASDLSNVRVYPNPWRANKHAGTLITFDNLGVDSTVKIFTLAGHVVRTLPPSNTSVTWDLTTDNGEKAASGLYIYLITAGGSKTRGKLAIVR